MQSCEIPVLYKLIRGHTRRMTSATQITVMFACPKCSAFYQAAQERRPDNQKSGKFKCQACSTEVYAWSGIYDYVDWMAAAVGSANSGHQFK
jgi:hypothetical protein